MFKALTQESVRLERSYLPSAELHVDGVQLRLVLQLAVAGEGGLGGSKPRLHVMS